MEKFLYQTNLNAIVGQLFSSYRERCQLDQFKVAEIVNINKSSMSKLESGQMNFNIDHIFTLCEIYNVKIDLMIKDLTKIIEKLERNNILIIKNSMLKDNLPVLSKKQISYFINKN